MAMTGPSFYDDDAVFATYMSHRQRADSPNETLEKPVIWDLLGPIAGKRILDLGCGDAAIGRELLGYGAASYVGIEASHNMAACAVQTLAGTEGHVIAQTIEAWMYPDAVFDLVVSRLALHYVADLAPVFANVLQALVLEGGLSSPLSTR